MELLNNFVITVDTRHHFMKAVMLGLGAHGLFKTLRSTYLMRTLKIIFLQIQFLKSLTYKKLLCERHGLQLRSIYWIFSALKLAQILLKMNFNS